MDVQTPLQGPIPTPDDVSRICATADPVLRNLQITQCYGDIARALAREVGPGANWCTFGTWASRQAGATIRGEDLLDRLSRRLERRTEWLHPLRSLWRTLLRRGLLRPDTRLGRIVLRLHTPFDAAERTAAAVARGNRKVFEEILLHFARYLQVCAGPEETRDRRVEQFASVFRPGGPPDGQELLRHAFGLYYAQRREPDPRRRAQMIALANLEIGLHEQTRLQPEIAAALDAPFETAHDLSGRALLLLVPGAPLWRLMLRGPLLHAVEWFADQVRLRLAGLTREAVTESLMVLTLPGAGTLALGRDLPQSACALLDPCTLPELTAFLERVEPPGPDGDASGVRDWADLSQRMHYITHVFRAFHDSPALFTPPFTDDQVRAIRAGRLPDSRL